MVGTWLEGSFGWHNSYRVVDRAIEFGFEVPADYADDLRRYRDQDYADLSEDDKVTAEEAIVGQGELADKATDFLNEKAPEDYGFEWDMGELSFRALELDDEELDEIIESHCDGIFGILDTARHNGWGVKRHEVRAHVNECESCQEHNSDLSWV
jgi:hypothetical protein